MRRWIFTDPKTKASIGIRSLLWYTPLRRFTFYRYWYNFTPEHLSFFANCLNQTRNVPGDIYELGCAKRPHGRFRESAYAMCRDPKGLLLSGHL